MNYFNKETFVEIINDILNSYNMGLEINKILNKYNQRDFKDGFCFTDSIMESNVIILLEYIMRDEDALINWWLSEKLMQDEPHLYIGDADIYLDTPEKLYDYLFDVNFIKE